MRRFLKSILIFVGATVVAIAGIVFIRAARVTGPPPPEPRVEISLDATAAAAHLGAAIRFQTVSTQDGTTDIAAFHRLNDYLESAYPLVHKRLTRETVGGYSLLYEWKGKDAAKAPIVLMGHTDVVPVIPGSESRWTHPAYSGEIDAGFLYGRGSLDDKGAVIAVLEAVERLLSDGYEPTRTIYLAFGGDEEVGGGRGAREMVKLLKARKAVEPAMVLDEGGAVVEGQFPGMSGPAAMIGISEKGYISLELSVEGEGGHSSQPPLPTHIGRISRAVAKLEAEQFPARLDGATLSMLGAMTPVQPFSRRLVLANIWLFRPVVMSGLLDDPKTASMVRTTTAPTVFNAGAKENVLPPGAKAIVNFQILPGETIQSVTARVKKVISDDAVKVQTVPGGFCFNPSPVSDPAGPAFTVLAKTVRQTLGQTPPLVLPFLTGPTDSRYWSDAGTKNVFRFTPFPYENDMMSRIHGTDERISVRGFADGVRFYMQLIRNSEEI
jgi:carboxypeptidase PM20D1